jgi:hypothetical protein
MAPLIGRGDLLAALDRPAIIASIMSRTDMVSIREATVVILIRASLN